MLFYLRSEVPNFSVLQNDFFDEYRIEGKDERNEIYLEIVTDNLVRAMKSAQNSQAVKMKLTRKQTSCLTFEVSLVCFGILMFLNTEIRNICIAKSVVSIILFQKFYFKSSTPNFIQIYPFSS